VAGSVWEFVFSGFCSIKSAIQPLFCDDSVPEIPDPAVIDSCEPMDDDRDFCGQDRIDIFAEPVPPDKSFSSHFDLFVHPERSLDSELTDIVVQDIADFSTALPHVQAIKLDNPPEATYSDSVHYCEQDFQHDLRKYFISFEPSTEHPSNHELFIGAEHQPFFPCACYVDYFVPQLFELSSQSFHATNRLSDRIILEECPEPEDDPPSYQESISSSESSVEYAHPYTYGLPEGRGWILNPLCRFPHLETIKVMLPFTAHCRRTSRRHAHCSRLLPTAPIAPTSFLSMFSGVKLNLNVASKRALCLDIQARYPT
jgi:hypothetical protein